ncbi:MAG: hypothetical protein QM749_18055 [Aquabacterium sp.]
MAYAMGYFDYYFLHYTNQSANAVGQGRQTILRLLSSEMFEHWYRFIFLGKGAGAVYGLTHWSSTLDAAGKIHLHSDLMKLVYEYGFIWSAVVVGVMYSVKSFRARMVAAYINVLFLTDNALIYYLLIFFIIMCSRMDPLDEPAPAATAMRPEFDLRRCR